MREGAKRRSWVLGLLKVTKNQSFLTRSTTSTSTLRINESTTVFERFMSLRIEIGEIMNRRRSMFFVALNSLASANCFFLRKSPWKASKLIKIDYKYDNVKEISEEAPLYVSWTSGSILFALIFDVQRLRILDSSPCVEVLQHLVAIVGSPQDICFLSWGGKWLRRCNGDTVMCSSCLTWNNVLR